MLRTILQGSVEIDENLTDDDHDVVSAIMEVNVTNRCFSKILIIS